MAAALRVHVAPLVEGTGILAREASHYVCDVHRLQPGARFVAFDPEAELEADATLIEARRGGARYQVGEPRRAQSGANGVTLLQALAKGDRLEQVARAATALGATGVRFVATERSQARPEGLRRERLRAICVDAARQSGRGDLPRLEGIHPLSQTLQALASEPIGLKLCLSPRAHVPLGPRLRDWSFGSPACVLIGPEGGFSDAELELSRVAGFESVSLGPLILRTELAATVVLGCFLAFAPPPLITL